MLISFPLLHQKNLFGPFLLSLILFIFFISLFPFPRPRTQKTKNLKDPLDYWHLKFIKKIRILTNPNLRQRSINQNLEEGYHLILMILELESKGDELPSPAFSSGSLPQYKFFSLLLLEGLTLHQTFGHSLRGLLRSFKKGLYRDLQFEKKFTKEWQGALVQMFLFFIIIWGLIGFSYSLLPFPLNQIQYLLILFLHLMGLGLYSFLGKKLHKKIFAPFPQYFTLLYRYKAFSLAQVPLKITLEQTKILSLIQNPPHSLRPLTKRILLLLERHQQEGLSPNRELSFLLDECWFLLELANEKFLEQTQKIRLLILVFFFLSSYLYYFYALFQRLMI